MSYNYSYLNLEVPDKEEVKAKTPNPAVKEIIEKLENEKIEIYTQTKMVSQ